SIALLFFAVVGISVVGVLTDAGGCPPTPRAQAGSQLVRVTLQGQQDPLRNQTAVVDKARSTVTYYVTSQSNLSGWVCAACSKGHQRACYLRRMDPWDLQTLQMALNTSKHSVSSCCSIPGMSGGWIELCTGSLNVLPCGFAGAVQALCEHTSIFWVQRGQGKWGTSPGRGSKSFSTAGPKHCSHCCPCSLAGPGRQRLIYLCIDICFPNNICVSICFYYLPE
uniref:BRICHOS domain containing 5 n=1 Tax=Zosterops lateralis melanops TaxID=1220523 RepID=A0A8D2PF61_ZOSLA